MKPKTAVVLSMTLVATLLLAGRSDSADAADALRIYFAYIAVNSPLGAIPGKGGSGAQVQNLDPSLDAQIVADFYHQNGSRPVTQSRPNVGAGSAANFYFPTQSLADGVYAGVVSADRPIAAIVRTDWYSSRGSAMYGNLVPGHEVFAPLVARGYGGQSSYVSIQNTDTSQPVEVVIELHAAGAATALVKASKTIGRGGLVPGLRPDDLSGLVPRREGAGRPGGPAGLHRHRQPQGHPCLRGPAGRARGDAVVRAADPQRPRWHHGHFGGQSR